jgi:hypothetical protein
MRCSARRGVPFWKTGLSIAALTLSCRSNTELELSTQALLAGGPDGDDPTSQSIRRFLDDAAVRARLRDATSSHPLDHWKVRAESHDGATSISVVSQGLLPSYACRGRV